MVPGRAEADAERRVNGAVACGRRPRENGCVDSLFPRRRAEIAPGAVHVLDWLALDEQRELVAACREWA